MKRLLLLACVILAAAPALFADINIDDNLGWGGFGVAAYPAVGQSFTADAANISWIGMSVATCNVPSPTQFQLDLLEGAGLSGPVIATKTLTVPFVSFEFIYFDFHGTVLTVGNVYTAVISQIAAPPECNNIGTVGGTRDIYSGGIAFFNGEALPNADFYLRVLSVHYVAQVQPPLNSDSIISFKAGRVVLVKFTLTKDGAPTCDLPPAQILVRVSKWRTLVLLAPFRGTDCQYIYQLPTKSFTPGSYDILILIPGTTPTPMNIGAVRIRLE